VSIYFLGLFRAFHFILCLQNLEHSFLIFWYLERKLVTQFFFERSIFKWRFEDYFINIFGLKKSCKVPKKIKATQKEVIACFLYSENCFFSNSTKKRRLISIFFFQKIQISSHYFDKSTKQIFWSILQIIYFGDSETCSSKKNTNTKILGKFLKKNLPVLDFF